ncbi:hypothetical protein INH39_07350 [Massilia violaceinigra]|uniref:Uncharacterized protein n=1 Tax=Massilia violaceinigra TaxID=2045208 RepID=A0ABY4A9L9_9BURK|nr:hypothetical protein [Massilia violaceinigra]UOD31503.1 hypothetical protein INH39_07350 [Massilia violaceinigra]
MSYVLEFIVAPLPEDDAATAWELARKIIETAPQNGPPHPAFVRLHDIITSVYPCLSSYADDDMAIDECPWSDGPLIDNFGEQSGSLGIVDSPDFISIRGFVNNIATELGINVLDEQMGKIRWSDPTTYVDRRYRIYVRGVEPGLDLEEVACALAAAYHRDQSEVRKLLVEQGDFVTGLNWISALRDQQLVGKLGANCTIGPDHAN